MTTDGANGCVEAVRETEIIGWVHNGRLPAGQLQTLQVTTDLGETATFSAHFFRPQVVDAMGFSGLHGFAIPRAILPEFRERVTFRDAAGIVLRDGDLPLAPLTGPEDAKPRSLILHIPKTAGTSLNLFLERNVARSEFCQVYEGSDTQLSSRQFLSFGAAQRSAFRIVIGHVFSSMSHDVPGARLMTFVREPLARLRSLVRYRVQRYDGSIGIGGGSAPIETAINEAMTTGVDNIHVRYIAGVRKREVETLDRTHLQRAIRIIEAQFDFIGRTETLDHDFRHFTDRLGLGAEALTRDNATATEATHEIERAMAAIDWPRVAARNALDIELHEWVRQHSHRINTRGRAEIGSPETSGARQSR